MLPLDTRRRISERGRIINQPNEFEDSQIGCMSSHIPQVSVGVPVYNGESHLAQAIDSILNQTFNDLELILCDNASTDRTEQICRRYLAADARVRYHRQPAQSKTTIRR